MKLVHLATGESAGEGVEGGHRPSYMHRSNAT
jgi:hypothetical protein